MKEVLASDFRGTSCVFVNQVYVSVTHGAYSIINTAFYPLTLTQTSLIPLQPEPKCSALLLRLGVIPCIELLRTCSTINFSLSFPYDLRHLRCIHLLKTTMFHQSFVYTCVLLHHTFRLLFSARFLPLTVPISPISQAHRRRSSRAGANKNRSIEL